jgi:hypothetical protein
MPSTAPGPKDGAWARCGSAHVSAHRARRAHAACSTHARAMLIERAHRHPQDLFHRSQKQSVAHDQAVHQVVECRERRLAVRLEVVERVQCRVRGGRCSRRPRERAACFGKAAIRARAARRTTHAAQRRTPRTRAAIDRRPARSASRPTPPRYRPRPALSARRFAPRGRRSGARAPNQCGTSRASLRPLSVRSP